MKIKKTIIIEKAAHIIMNTGLEALTIQNLAAELDVNENQLHNHQLTKDDDILLMLLIGFRLFMKDEQRVHEMILELKTLKTLND